MTPQQGQLALVRSSDPQSSRDAAARCRPNVKRATILSELARYPESFDCFLTADICVEKWGDQRNVWSKRLGEAAELGLLDKDVTAKPNEFRINAAGREAARFLRDAS